MEDFTFNPDKPEPAERLKTEELWTIWKRLTDDDAKRAKKRAIVQGAVDGNAPWDPAVLEKHGQADRTNVNFLELGTVIQDWEDAYYDLALSVPKIFNLEPAVQLGEDVLNIRCTIEQEMDRILKRWPGWMTNHLSQINQLVTHGHGHYYFPYPRSWKFRPLKVNQVCIPDDFDDTFDNLPICGIGPFPMTLLDMWKLIRTPEAKAYSKSNGWDIEVIKQTITEYANRGVAEDKQCNYEVIQERLQRGNISIQGDANLNKGCQVCHLLVKEYDGKITKYIFAENTNLGKPLFKKEEVAEKITELVSFFFLRGSKTNYHEVRGIGRDGYNSAVVLNRLACRVVDEAEEAMTPTYKTTGGAGNDGRDTVRRKGRYNLVPQNWESMGEKAHGTFQAGSAGARTIRNLLASATKSPSLLQSVMRDSTQPRTAAEIEASNNMGQDVRITFSTLYYGYRDFFLQQVYRRFFGERLTDYEPGFAEQTELWGRLIQKGVTAEMWDPQNWDIKASRAVGNGSTASRRNALMAVGEIYPRLDTKGQRNWDKEWTSLNVGYDLSSQYVADVNRDEAPSADRSYAELENAILMGGQFPVSASPDQPPRLHCMVHLQLADQIAQQFKQGGDPSGHPGLEQLLVHTSQHIDFMLQDQALLEEAQQWKERLAGFVDILKEMGRQLQGMQEAQQKQQQGEQQKQIEIEAAKRSGAAEAEFAVKLEKVHADKAVKEIKAADTKELKEKQQASAFQLAMKKLDQDFAIAQQKEARERKPAPK